MSYLKFDKTLMTNLEEALPREILRTNRSGAYHCTTIVDCNTRKYHGLLVIPVPELDDENHVLLSSLDETVIQHGAEFNLVLKVKPHQVTLVPDDPSQITSNSGWDTKANQEFLTEVLDQFNSAGIRTSVFVAADPEMVEYAAKAGADRVELYTEPYATDYPKNPEAAIAPFIEAAKTARKLGIGLNAGHDLSLVNLNYFYKNIPWVDEVSIGHALISDALYLGLERTIQEYKNCLRS